MITEADTCRKYVLPKLTQAGWDNEPHSFTGSVSRFTQLIALIPRRICIRKEKQDLCEFDGAMFSIKGKRRSISRMNLFLLEAKSGRTISKNEARKQIQKKLKRLGGLYKQGRVFNLSRRSAYAMIDLVMEN